MRFHFPNTIPEYAILVCLLLVASGCIEQKESQVIVFSALDREFSQPVFQQFESETGIQVLTKFDTESTKTIGLANQILQQNETAACDFFWNNEILHTLRLERAGKLDVITPGLLEHIPQSFRSSENHWVGIAARARVIIVNTKLLPDPTERPSSVLDIVDPKWKGRSCIAKPLFGTTATHFAVIYQKLGEEEFVQLLDGIKTNDVGILSGNRQVAADVAAGKYVFGVTDTDDFNVEKLAGANVEIIFPDQDSGKLGTLLIPNTLSIVKNCSHPKQAETLMKFLLSGKIEERLAEGPSVQIPLDDRITVTTPKLSTTNVLWMEVDWAQMVEAWDKSSPILTKAFY